MTYYGHILSHIPGKSNAPCSHYESDYKAQSGQHYSPKAALLSSFPFGRVDHALLLGSTLNSTSSIKLRCPSATQQLTVVPLYLPKYCLYTTPDFGFVYSCTGAFTKGSKLEILTVITEPFAFAFSIRITNCATDYRSTQ